MDDIRAVMDAEGSARVKDLVVGSGIGFDLRGAHTLKGVPDEWRVFAVRI